MTDKKATLTINHGDGTRDNVDLPLLEGTLGPDVINVGSLTGKGYFTYDPGFTSTASCESKITFIDGDKGILLHRGYPIEQLAEHSDYLETCYLLLYGELPDSTQKDEFFTTVRHHTMVHEQIRTFFNGFRRDAHPMAIMCGVVGALSGVFITTLPIFRILIIEPVAAYRLIAKMPTIAAMSYKFSIGQPFMYPDNSLDYAANFLTYDVWQPLRVEQDITHHRAGDGPHLFFSMRTMNKMHQPQRCASPDLLRPIPSPVSLPAIAALWGTLTRRC